jgi:hypothetical protein
MKFRFVVVVLAATLLSACTGCGDSTESANKNAALATPSTVTPPEPVKPAAPPDPNYKACNDYFPVVPGSVAKYVMTYSTGLVADATVVVDKVDEGGKQIFLETAQIVDRSGGLNINQTTKRRFMCDGPRVQILSENTNSVVEGKLTVTTMRYRDNSLIAPEPEALHRKGFTWTYALYPVFAREGLPPATPETPTIVTMEVQGEADVTVPAGTFKAIKLQRKVNQNKSWDYLVPGMGMVKREAGEGLRWELKEYSGLKAQS